MNVNHCRLSNVAIQYKECKFFGKIGCSISILEALCELVKT
jgi:hypothetical protein